MTDTASVRTFTPSVRAALILLLREAERLRQLDAAPVQQETSNATPQPKKTLGPSGLGED